MQIEEGVILLIIRKPIPVIVLSFIEINSYFKTCPVLAVLAASSTTNSVTDHLSDPLPSSTAPVFTGANIGSISACIFQLFHGNVKIVQSERKRRTVIESDEED